MAKRVAVTYLLPDGNFNEKLVKTIGADFIIAPCRSGDEIVNAAKEADAIITALTFQSFSREIINKLDGVRHIASLGVGFDRIDLAAASRKTIVVTNTPVYCIDEVSDHAMALILALSRKLFQLNRIAKTFRWRSNDAGVINKFLRPMKKLRGQTLGLIGFGRIAKALVPKAKGFGLEVIAYDRYVTKEEMEAHFGVKSVELKELLRTADFVSLHVNLEAGNEKMLKEEHFRSMKRGSYFINTARGALVDEAALARVLSERWIAGAGLDVMANEPPFPDNPLLKMENVIITGHFAQYSDDSEKKLWQVPLEEVALTLRGEFPRFAVNPRIRDKWLNKWRN